MFTTNTTYTDAKISSSYVSSGYETRSNYYVRYFDPFFAWYTDSYEEYSSNEFSNNRSLTQNHSKSSFTLSYTQSYSKIYTVELGYSDPGYLLTYSSTEVEESFSYKKSLSFITEFQSINSTNGNITIKITYDYEESAQYYAIAFWTEAYLDTDLSWQYSNGSSSTANTIITTNYHSTYATNVIGADYIVDGSLINVNRHLLSKTTTQTSNSLITTTTFYVHGGNKFSGLYFEATDRPYKISNTNSKYSEISAIGGEEINTDIYCEYAGSFIPFIYKYKQETTDLYSYSVTYSSGPPPHTDSTVLTITNSSYSSSETPAGNLLNFQTISTTGTLSFTNITSSIKTKNVEITNWIPKIENRIPFSNNYTSNTYKTSQTETTSSQTAYALPKTITQPRQSIFSFRPRTDLTNSDSIASFTITEGLSLITYTGNSHVLKALVYGKLSPDDSAYGHSTFTYTISPINTVYSSTLKITTTTAQELLMTSSSIKYGRKLQSEEYYEYHPWHTGGDLAVFYAYDYSISNFIAQEKNETRISTKQTPKAWSTSLPVLTPFFSIQPRGIQPAYSYGTNKPVYAAISANFNYNGRTSIYFPFWSYVHHTYNVSVAMSYPSTTSAQEGDTSYLYSFNLNTISVSTYYRTDSGNFSLVYYPVDQITEPIEYVLARIRAFGPGPTYFANNCLTAISEEMDAGTGGNLTYKTIVYNAFGPERKIMINNDGLFKAANEGYLALSSSTYGIAGIQGLEVMMGIPPISDTNTLKSINLVRYIGKSDTNTMQ